MINKLYVGNLNYAVTQQDLTDFFMSAGTVLESIVVMDRGTGNSRGFGFVTMSSEIGALDAIEKLNGKELLGREIKIKLALEEKTDPTVPTMMATVTGATTVIEEDPVTDGVEIVAAVDTVAGTIKFRRKEITPISQRWIKET